MSRPIIEVHDLWKEFRLGGNKESYLSLRDSLGKVLRPSRNKERFWALSELNFSVEEGESLAIIGRNGAGKSTLLKILSRITPPTKGHVDIRGRMASLLEVGTGFHPELTGKENIFLNGSILGLKRNEIQKQFDAIVDFSGVERFLETPLKHYSSGMQLRLAFSVAAHLEPEILVIDEVLAVGDTAFQQKCIKKMTEVSQSGRTILFVSHNLNAVRNLCQRSVLLESGRIRMTGDTNEVIDEYVRTGLELTQELDMSGFDKRSGKGELKFKHLSFEKPYFDVGDDICFTLDMENPSGEAYDEVDIGVAIRDMEDLNLIHISNKFLGQALTHTDQSYQFRIKHSLKPGTYKVILFFRTGVDIQDWIQEGVQIRIERMKDSFKANSHGILEPDFSISQIKNSEQ
jgi:lipopolysaccharide transport system ATP-binding protein